jgi:hypothetical protein
MAKTKKTPAAAAKTTSPTKSPSFSGSPRRKSSELKKLEAVSTRGSRRINLLANGVLQMEQTHQEKTIGGVGVAWSYELLTVRNPLRKSVPCWTALPR